MLSESLAATNPELQHCYSNVRQRTLELVKGFSAEDMMLQSMPDASPGKWHLAHTSWFFETFILKPHALNYRVFNDSYEYLFNSYYDSVGERHPRPNRGLLSRPGLEQILAYRRHIDDAMQAALASPSAAAFTETVIIGLHHEMQHQELILTDIKHALAQNPVAMNCPGLNNVAASPAKPFDTPTAKAALPLKPFTTFDEGVYHIGAQNSGFSYDCERPSHRVFCEAFALANRPVSNSEWLEFIRAGGYQDPGLWLSDGWARCQSEQWQAPLYWQRHEGEWYELRLDGYHPLDLAAPVCHISYYEADAFARWAGGRLPTEYELEIASQKIAIAGNFAESGRWHPSATDATDSLQQLYGDVWEWSSSSYSPYPGFHPEQGALGEYNGKFMANQYVLRGGSCATAQAQMRPSYRNFFYPHQRWQFSGLRLAQ
ncbi:ergothioneine biosynthesis protein EgtB [uncultured Gilvimarinus sp.]|uniref:ergothioneine biosynthesis protein EgtB n=1 Tax=uncultured Gilvimarinus sp. TaxID=1689143 RepID=UPI0030EE4194|tara:strand:+ start:2704 stop:3993 length:1290 start_codon:yes stop_codon:yes gene_type:complete